jgi:hypothetical protein
MQGGLATAVAGEHPVSVCGIALTSIAVMFAAIVLVFGVVGLFWCQLATSGGQGVGRLVQRLISAWRPSEPQRYSPP